VQNIPTQPSKAATYFTFVFFVLSVAQFATPHKETTPPHVPPKPRSLSFIASIISANYSLIVTFVDQKATS
jgi:hypothetical protein